ncbi:MAG: LNS2 domain-containing protein [Acidothermaceae bacterium]
MPEPPSACVVIDIDGVVADLRHRLHYLDRNPKDWQKFFAGAKDDQLLEIGAEFARTASSTHVVVYLTGRPERLRRATTTWLAEHELPDGTLVMRRDGDHRPAVMVKLQQLRQLQRDMAIDLVVDDDPVVIRAVREAGFAARLADWMPRTPSDDTLQRAQENDGRT